MPIHHTYQCHVLVTLLMLDIKTGSGCQVISHISLLYTQGTRPYCYYNSNIAMAHGVCALESSCVGACVSRLSFTSQESLHGGTSLA